MSNYSEEQRRREGERLYDKARWDAQRNWDDRTKKRMNLIMFCLVIPLILLICGALVIGALLSG